MDLRKVLRICVPPFYGKEEGSPDIYTVSPLFTIPENDFIKYEMNYRQLGKRAAKMLIKRQKRPEGKKRQQKSIQRKKAQQKKKKGLWEKMPESSVTEDHVNRMMVGDGFQNWFVNIRKPESSQPLNIVTLDSPEAYIMKTFFAVIYPENGS